MDTIIIDAYNVINSWQKTAALAKEDMAAARDFLNDTLQNYASYQGTYLIVVYDAYKTDAVKETVDGYENMQIVYTKTRQTADAYIESLIFQMKDLENIGVVSSDWTLQKMVISGGLLRIPASEFVAKIELIEKQIETKYDKEPQNTSAFLNPIFKDPLS